MAGVKLIIAAVLLKLLWSTHQANAQGTVQLLLPLLLLSATAKVHTLPTGAPIQACDDITPQPGHGAASQDITTIPYTLNTSQFLRPDGSGVYSYLPGETYTLILSVTNTEFFRGLLVQGRTVADGSPIGAFISDGVNTRLSSCSQQETAITHSNRDDKISEVLTWTAPPAGAGELIFRYAVVQEYDPVGVGPNLYWASVETAVIGEREPCVLPLFLHNGQCVETCPQTEPPFWGGNASLNPPQCTKFPDNYMAMLNSTIYVANITLSTPLLTPVIHISLFIDNVLFQSPQLVILSIIRNDVVQNTFRMDVRGSLIATEDFVNSEDVIFFPPVDASATPTIVIERDIVYFAEPPTDLPVTFDFDITAVIVGRTGTNIPGGFIERQSLGVVTIYPGPACITTAGTPTIGQSYNLTCSAYLCGGSGLDGIITFRWTDLDGNLVSTTSSVIFPSLALSQAGTYTCAATVIGSMYGNFTANGMEDVSIQIASPQINVVHDGGCIIYAGTMLTLTCEIVLVNVLPDVRDGMTVTTSWLGGGNVFTGGNSITITEAEQVADTTYISMLTFSSLRTTNTGIYTCQATVNHSSQFITEVMTSNTVMFTVQDPATCRGISSDASCNVTSCDVTSCNVTSTSCNVTSCNVTIVSGALGAVIGLLLAYGVLATIAIIVLIRRDHHAGVSIHLREYAGVENVVKSNSVTKLGDSEIQTSECAAYGQARQPPPIETAEDTMYEVIQGQNQ